MNLFLFFLSMLSTSSYALERSVTTTGKCVAESAPDRASIIFTVEKVNKDSKIAIHDATELYEKVLAEFKKTKIKDLELSTEEYSVFEKTEYQKDKNVHLGIGARIGLKARANDVSDIATLIQIAATLGVTETTQFVSYLSDEKEMIEKKKCLEDATLKAKEKAQTLAKTLGMKLGKPILIAEKDAGSFAPMNAFAIPAPMMMKANTEPNEAKPSLQSPKQKITQEVEVNFSLE